MGPGPCIVEPRGYLGQIARDVVIETVAGCAQLRAPYNADCVSELQAGSPAYVATGGMIRRSPMPVWAWIAIGIGLGGAVAIFGYGLTRKGKKKRRRRRRR